MMYHEDDDLYLPQVSGMPGLPPQPVYPPNREEGCIDGHGHGHWEGRKRKPCHGGQPYPVCGHFYGAMNPNAPLKRTGPAYVVKWGDGSDAGSAETSAPGKKDTRKITLLFYREALLYDIANLAYVEGDIMADNQQDVKHQVQDIVESGNIDRINRTISLTMAECVESLYPFTKRKISRLATYEDIDNITDDEDPYEITLTLPSDFSMTSVDYIAKLLHEYIVCKALADWMSIVNPSVWEKWSLKATAVKNDIKSALTSRIGVKRRKLSVF